MTAFTPGSPVTVSRRHFVASTSLLAIAASAGSISAAAMPTTYKAAVFGDTGRGNYGHNLDLIFADRPGIEVVAVADRDPAGRAKALARIGAARAYADFHELLERERPDLVCVAPRWTEQHHAMLRAALQAGAHVYCEKPFTTTLAEADEVLALARSRGRRIAVAHQGRVAPSTLELKRRLDAGLIGDLVEIQAWGKQDKRAGGEDLVVLGTHQFDLIRLFAGDPVWCSARILQGGHEVTRADIHAATEGIGPIVGDEIDATFAFPRGVIAHFTSRAQGAAATGPWGMELLGTHGRVRLLNDVYPQTFLLHREGGPVGAESRRWRPLPGDTTGSATAEERGFIASNRRVVDDWLAAIAAQREPICSGADAMKSLEMIHAVFAAGLARGRIAFPLADRAHPLA